MIRESIDPPAMGSLSQYDRRTLLELARSTAARTFDGQTPEPAAREITGRLGGLFVTFWHGTKLRGCIGTLGPVENLTHVVPQVTRSAFTDGRFVDDPITAAELSEIRIELSFLSDPRPTKDPLSLVPGTHGLIVRRGTQLGCFLPKVAAERGWSAEEALRHCCEMKAGLPGDSWRDADTEVLLFIAETIAEGEPGGGR